MRISLSSLLFLCAFQLGLSFSLAADGAADPAQHPDHAFLDSRIGTRFPDAQVASNDKQKSSIAQLNQNGLIVLFAKSPCKWASRAAGIVAKQGWQINGQDVVIVHRRWARSSQRQFRKDVPQDAPLYRIPSKALPGWLNEVRISPVFFQLDPEGVVLDWAIRVPGDEGPAWKSRLGSVLAAPDPKLELGARQVTPNTNPFRHISIELSLVNTHSEPVRGCIASNPSWSSNDGTQGFRPVVPRSYEIFDLSPGQEIAWETEVRSAPSVGTELVFRVRHFAPDCERRDYDLESNPIVIRDGESGSQRVSPERPSIGSSLNAHADSM